MENGQISKKNQRDESERRRGRPTGRNRIPLTLEERRARNAQYEKERRQDTAHAMAQLAEAVGCDPDISNAEILATGITKIKELRNQESLNDLTKKNSKLLAEITNLQKQLGLGDAEFDKITSDATILAVSEASISGPSGCSSTNKQSKKRKRSSSCASTNDKRSKTKSETSNDSGVDLRRQSVSPTECSVSEPQCSVSAPLCCVSAVEEQEVLQSYVGMQDELFNQIISDSQPLPVMPILEADVTIEPPSRLPPQQPPPAHGIEEGLPMAELVFDDLTGCELFSDLLT